MVLTIKQSSISSNNLLESKLQRSKKEKYLEISYQLKIVGRRAKNLIAKHHKHHKPNLEKNQRPKISPSIQAMNLPKIVEKSITPKRDSSGIVLYLERATNLNRMKGRKTH